MHPPRPTVYLFTETYPFPGPDDPFLPAEVAVLSRRMDVRLIPSVVGPGEVPSLPPGVEFDDRLAAFAATPRVRGACLARALLSPTLYGELRRQWPLSRSPRAMATTALRLARAFAVRSWIRRELADEIVGDRPRVVYTWWSAAYAVGVALALSQSPVPMVTRAHGFDLYAEQEVVGFVPFQRTLVQRADAVVSVSQAGADYLRSRYPDLRARIVTSYLGVEGPPARSSGSTDGVLRIVSCSGVVPVKRLELLAESLAELGRRQPDVTFEWTHIGGGPLLVELQQRVAASPFLARCTTFTGQVEPEDVRAWFESHEVDAIVNVSASEGLPVSLMEAASFGVPLIATAVGGTAEIVDDSCGRLLPADPCVDDVAGALADIARLSAYERDAIRNASRERWESRFAADRNYAEFRDLLESLVAR
jgi:glycosyltransferase involved in cell wall biosynthesis